MSGTQMTNLDIQCADLGRKLANIPNMEERIINAALTVLEEQGPYAMFLYLRGRHGNVSKHVEKHSLDLLHEVFGDRSGNSNDVLNVITNLAQNLDDLLFARDLLRTALSYARYHLKAKGGGTS